MPAAYLHLDLEERRKIARWREARVPVTEIAHRLARHRSTIFRELNRNRFVDAELQYLSGYYAMTAHEIAPRKRADLRKLVRHSSLHVAVIDRLQAGWTPE
jgi:IS30 family transposase